MTASTDQSKTGLMIAAPAGTMTGTTLASNVVNASLNSITPSGGTLAVVGTTLIGEAPATANARQLIVDYVLSGNGYGRLQSIRQDVGFTPLVLNDSGGNVLIGTTTNNGVHKLQVAGSISATAISETFISTAATTSPRSLHLSNTGGDVYFGIEGSSGGGYFTGSTAYATVVYSTQQPVQTIINGVKRTEVDSSGLSVTGSISATTRVNYPSYTVATLPAVGSAGGNIYVSDESGGAQPAFSDGTNWRRYTDRAVVS